MVADSADKPEHNDQGPASAFCALILYEETGRTNGEAELDAVGRSCAASLGGHDV
jgi:hypothetical protein